LATVKLPDFLPVIQGKPSPTMRMMHISTNAPPPPSFGVSQWRTCFPVYIRFN
jgi:hypothetical protein